MDTQSIKPAEIVEKIYMEFEEEAIKSIKIKSTKIAQKMNDNYKNYYRQLEEYMHGRRKQFHIPLKPFGTLFQMAVWNATSTIPYGETRTYKEVAAMVGSPNAARAVGNALSKNPICIIIPCHRVLPSNGTVGKYAYGETVKKFLLDLEKEGIRKE